jgi:hypothetical protein
METIVISLAGSFFLIAVEGIDIIVRSGFSGASARRSYSTPVPARKIRLHKGIGLDAQGAHDIP